MENRLPRGSGLLLHPTSLPGRFGIGDIGPQADAFLDFLSTTGQRWWQVLPLGPTGFGHSPYQSPSSHAGNPLLISPERLVEDGLLSDEDLKAYPTAARTSVDFDAVYPAKERLLRRAYERFDLKDREYRAFCKSASTWLTDFALYQALKVVHGHRAWTDWEPDLAGRKPRALARARKELGDEIEFVHFVQYIFDCQWNRLRERALARGVRLIGDVPIFVAHDSADVWAHRHLFELDDKGQPTVVAGVPPDYFSKTGQLWGNPLYRWDIHSGDGYAWWADRMRSILKRVDLVRLDHFRGFQAYWEIPASAPTAEVGRWVLGPGFAFLRAMRTALGGLPIIAEDLGFITYEVHALRDQAALPGMRILEFAFSEAEDDRPFNFPHHCVAYTGTHDNETVVGWFTSQGSTTETPEQIAAERQLALRYLGTDGHEIHWDMIRLALSSVADSAIIPVQDLLGLGSEARMNRPGHAEGNWCWRLRGDELTDEIAGRLGEMTRVYGRWNHTPAAANPDRARSERPRRLARASRGKR